MAQSRPRKSLFNILPGVLHYRLFWKIDSVADIGTTMFHIVKMPGSVKRSNSVPADYYLVRNP